jgi:hypothetical protein
VNRRIFAQCLEKVAQTVAKPKIAKIFTSKLNLKVQNINMKVLFKPKNLKIPATNLTLKLLIYVKM